MMSKQDYAVIAMVVRGIMPASERYATAMRFADELSLRNARFDRRKFFIACGIIANVEKIKVNP